MVGSSVVALRRIGIVVGKQIRMRRMRIRLPSGLENDTCHITHIAMSHLHVEIVWSLLHTDFPTFANVIVRHWFLLVLLRS